MDLHQPRPTTSRIAPDLRYRRFMRATSEPKVPEPEVPVLNSERFVLRRWNLTDADVSVVLQAAQDPQIARYSRVGLARTPQAAAQWIRTRDVPGRLDWAMTTSDSVLGRVSLADIDEADGVAELGYWLLPEHRGRGLASEAVGAVERSTSRSILCLCPVSKAEPSGFHSLIPLY